MTRSSVGIERSLQPNLLGIFFHSWATAARREHNFAQDRLMLRLMYSQNTGRVMIAQPYRSRISRLSRIMVGRRDQPVPSDLGPRVSYFEPHRWRRRDSTEVETLKRMFNKYDNLLEEYMVRKNFMQPSVVITHPLAAGLLPLRWARRVTYYATDDWASA